MSVIQAVSCDFAKSELPCQDPGASREPMLDTRDPFLHEPSHHPSVNGSDEESSPEDSPLTTRRKRMSEPSEEDNNICEGIKVPPREENPNQTLELAVEATKENMNAAATLASQEAIPSPGSPDSPNSNSVEKTLVTKQLSAGLEELELNPDEEMFSPEWLANDRHVFVLSEAGKPIYTRHGVEDRLVTLFGVMQALVSVVQDADDSLLSIQSGDTHFAFLVKGPLILVAVSKIHDSVSQLRLLLTYVFNQIVSVLTATQLYRIFEQRHNYDLRRLLAGSERLMDSLIDQFDQDPALVLGAVHCLPMGTSDRDAITQTIVKYCSKIKNLVFGVVIGQDRLIALVRMKKFALHPADVHLITNLVRSTEAFKSAEGWTPICLPKFDSSGFLHAHVSYLADDCPACFLLLSTDRDDFFPLSEAKQKIVERLRRHGLLDSINTSLRCPEYSVERLGLPELRHFLYKCKSSAQCTWPRLSPPYTATPEAYEALLGLYRWAHHRIHYSARPLRLLYKATPTEILLGWATAGFELFAVFEPFCSKLNLMNAANLLLKWIKKEEDWIFILNPATL
nr:EOG090X03TW [Triops cancriformis]